MFTKDNIVEYISISTVDEAIFTLTATFSGLSMDYNSFVMCIDDFLLDIKAKSIPSVPEQTVDGFESDEVIDNDSNPRGYNRYEVDRITSDMSSVVLSKLVCGDEIIGYRFRLNNGCLDISRVKGEELGITPYKVGRRIDLKLINGIYASNFECKNKIFFPDISSDDVLCKKLIQAVLS